METKILVASFKEAFVKFLSYTDGLSVNTLDSFKNLKSDGVIIHFNKDEFWCGNHHSSSSDVRLYMVNKPLQFFVVEFNYSEMSERSHSYSEKTVFIVE